MNTHIFVNDKIILFYISQLQNYHFINYLKSTYFINSFPQFSLNGAVINYFHRFFFLILELNFYYNKI